MADGSTLILGSEANSASNRTSLTKTQGFLPVMDLFNDHGVGLLIIAGESVVHGGQPSQGEALAAFSPGTAVVGTGTSPAYSAPARTPASTRCATRASVFEASPRPAWEFADNPARAPVCRRRAPAVSDSTRPALDAPRSSDPVCVVLVSWASQGSHGVVGFARRTGTGVIGVSVNGLGGEFYGSVRVVGDLLVIGGSKSAAVRHADGSYRRLYTLESPESWFEDLGRAELRRGKAMVALRPDFAAVIDRKAMHVFLSPEGDCDGLYVSGQNGKAFSVRERQRGTSSVTFSYRVVGRRKDIRGERMKKVSVPRTPPAPEPEPAVVAIKPRKARTPDFYGTPTR